MVWHGGGVDMIKKNTVQGKIEEGGWKKSRKLHKRWLKRNKSILFWLSTLKLKSTKYSFENKKEKYSNLYSERTRITERTTALLEPGLWPRQRGPGDPALRQWCRRRGK